jgi:hypothetical protein
MSTLGSGAGADARRLLRAGDRRTALLAMHASDSLS